MQKKHLAGLDYVEVFTPGSEANAEPRTVVLLHGYGADCYDLASLAQMIPQKMLCRWIFPNGPLSVPIGPHMTGGAWFPIDMRELEAAMMRGSFRDFSGAVPPGFLEATEKVKTFIEALAIPSSQLVLGGFSQGAMLACEVSLNMSTPPSATLLLSATLVSSARWKEALSAKKKLRVFQSHGSGDLLLSYKDAEELRRLLIDAGVDHTWSSFSGGHEIPMTVLRDLGSFLAR